MKKVIKFSVRLVLFILAMVVMIPAFLIFVEGDTLLPNFFGLAYVASFILIYKIEEPSGWLHKFVWLYKRAFGKFFDL